MQKSNTIQPDSIINKILDYSEYDFFEKSFQLYSEIIGLNITSIKEVANLLVSDINTA